MHLPSRSSPHSDYVRSCSCFFSFSIKGNTAPFFCTIAPSFSKIHYYLFISLHRASFIPRFQMLSQLHVYLFLSHLELIHRLKLLFLKSNNLYRRFVHQCFLCQNVRAFALSIFLSSFFFQPRVPPTNFEYSHHPSGAGGGLLIIDFPSTNHPANTVCW